MSECTKLVSTRKKELKNLINNTLRTLSFWAWFLMPVTLALGRLRQEDCHQFEVSLDCERQNETSFHKHKSNNKQTKSTLC